MCLEENSRRHILANLDCLHEVLMFLQGYESPRFLKKEHSIAVGFSWSLEFTIHHFYLVLSLCKAEGRGVKDPERLKRQQKRREDAEKEALKQGPSDGGLKVHCYIVQI